MSMSKSESGRLGGLKGGLHSKKLKEERMAEYYSNPKICKGCDGVISYEKKRNIFCGHSCSASANNKGKCRTGHQLIQEKNCMGCGVNFKPKNSSSKYCKRKCQHKHYYDAYIERWKNGEEDGVVGGAWLSKNIRKYIFEKYDAKCTRCGWCEVNTYSGKVPLEVEHINGNPLDNREENLDLLCPNCHSLTSTSKALNKGNGRSKRMARYYEDKNNAGIAPNG